MRRYFTLEQVKENLGILPTFSGPLAFFTDGSINPLSRTTMPAFINLVLNSKGYSTYMISMLQNSNELWKLWSEYIYPKFYTKCVCYTDDDTIPDDDAEKVFADFVGPIISWMISSTEKYSLLITNFEAHKTELLDNIKSTRVSRFNDTPQDNGTFEDETHNTNVNKEETSVQAGTMLSRLNEIEDNIKQLYEKWSNEFRKFIVWSV